VHEADRVRLPRRADRPVRMRAAAAAQEPEREHDDHHADDGLRAALHGLRQVRAVEHDRQAERDEARRVAEANERRMRDETEAERQRRLDETHKQIEAETRRALDLIRTEVADLSLVAATKVTGKALDDADHRRLIEEAVGELDFSVLESRNN